MADSATVGVLRVLLTMNTAEFDSAMKRVSASADRFGKDFKNIGAQATALGSSLTKTLTVPLVGLGLGAAKLAVDFESSFAGVRKTVDASEEEFKQMAEAFRGLSKEIPVNVNELNRLGEAAGALGIPKGEIVDFAKVMAELGVTTNLTSDQAAESIAKIQTVFQAAGKETDRFGAALVHLGNNGASTEAEILALANRIASAGRAVGMSQDEVLGFSAAIANVGIEAEAGGTAISKVFSDISISVSKGGDAVKDFAKVAGMSVRDFQKLFKDDASAAVTAFIEGIGRAAEAGTDLNQLLEQLGFTEVRQARALRDLALSGQNLRNSLDQSAQGWRENSALTNEAAERFKTTESQLTLLWNRLKDVGITLGNALLPTINMAIQLVGDLVPIIENLAKAFGALPDWLQASIVGLAGLAAAIGPLLWVVGQLSTGLGLVVSAFGAKGLAVRALTPVLGTLAGTTLPALAVSLGAVTAAAWGLHQIVKLLTIAGNMWTESAQRQKGEQLEQERRYKMMEQASKIAGRSVLTYAEAVQIVTAHTRKMVDEQERSQVVYDRAAGPPEKLKTVYEGLALGVGEADKALQKLRDTLSGKEAFAEADQWMRLIGEIGGIAKLTTEEQQRAAQVLGEALDKYTALGRKAPQALSATVIQLTAMNQRAKDGDSFIEHLGIQFDETFTSVKPKIALAIAELERFRGVMPGFEKAQTRFTPLIPGAFPERDMLALGDQSGKAVAKGMAAALGDTLKTQLGPTIMSALTGGGNIGQAIGGLIGGSLTSSLGGILTKQFPSMFGEAAKGLSGFLGNILGSFLPGVGALLGPLMGKIGGFFKGLFGGVSEEVKKARTDLEGFQKTLRGTLSAQEAAGLEGWEQDIVAIKKAYLALGKSEQEALADAEALWDTDNPERSRAAIERVNAALKAQEEQLERNKEAASEIYDGLMDAAEETGERLPAHFLPYIEQMEKMGLLTKEQAEALRGLADESEFDLKRLQEDAEALGIDFNALGPKFQNAKLGAGFEDLYFKMKRLIAAGGDVGTVLAGSSDEISALVVEAKKFGTSVPQQFKPWIEELLRAGKLVDENGNKLEDLSGINFGDPIVSAMEKMTSKLEEFINTLLGVPAAVDKIPKTITIEEDYVPDPERNLAGGPGGVPAPGYQHGTIAGGTWFRNFGAETLARLHGLEAVIKPSQALDFASAMLQMGAPQADTRLAAAVMAALAAMESTITQMQMTFPLAMRDAVRGAI